MVALKIMNQMVSEKKLCVQEAPYLDRVPVLKILTYGCKHKNKKIAQGDVNR